MTDKQLSIYVRMWAERLSHEVDTLREQLPRDWPRDQPMRIDRTGDFEVLHGLANLVQRMHDEAALLDGTGTNTAWPYATSGGSMTKGRSVPPSGQPLTRRDSETQTQVASQYGATTRRGLVELQVGDAPAVCMEPAKARQIAAWLMEAAEAAAMDA
jgi:hypothetical protein